MKSNPFSDIADAIEGKRGCTQNCIYCTNSLIAGSQIQFKPYKDIIEEVKAINRLGIAKRFEFTDGAFNLPVAYAKKVCDGIISSGNALPWNCMFSPTGNDEELIERMRYAGCDYVEVGSESGDNNILRRLNKSFSVDDVLSTQRNLVANDYRIEQCFFIGAPGETVDSVWRTLDLLQQIGSDKKTHILLNFGLRIFKGTELQRIAIEDCVIDDDDELLFPKYYIAPSIIHNDKLLDALEAWTLKNKNCYLWWGSPHYPLRQRLREVQTQYATAYASFSRM
jgi:radical SAM superfamily enzyme YgiQ (UPF0313 family)